MKVEQMYLDEIQGGLDALAEEYLKEEMEKLSIE